LARVAKRRDHRTDMSRRPCCAVCLLKDELTPIQVAGRRLHLCERHARALGDTPPTSFEDLAALFAARGLDRRRRRDRRRYERRQFPLRPELRRHNMGRRGMDPAG
jgi:hypothetical protein